MDVIETGQKITEFEQRVMWRKRWLAMQDHFALAMIAGGLLSAAFILYVRLRAIDFSSWAIAATVFGALFAGLGILWFVTRARAAESAFLIDEALALEDRVSTATLIIERGGPEKEVEQALLDDASDHIKGKAASEVLPYRMPRWYGLAAVGIIALGVSIFIPQSSLPGAEARAEERADIEMAGEQLEQAAAEVERIAPLGTETATLASEQAELGRALRRSNETRAEALKKLSGLGERIQQRHEELSSTRADEIVSLAEKRLGAALAALPKPKPQGKSDLKESAQPDAKAGRDESPVADVPGAEKSGENDRVKNDRIKNDTAAKQPGKEVAGKTEGRKQADANTKDQPESKPASADSTGEKAGGVKPEQGPDKQKPVSDAQPAGSSQQNQQASEKKPAGEQGAPADATKDDQSKKDEQAKGEQQPDSEKKDSGLFPTLSNLPNAMTNAMTSAVTEQAAKALPSLSEQLLKKAEQLRANELKPEDIQQLRQAAEFLARDLSKIAQSKELQQAVEQMARQINPQQLEQVAQQLLSQEKVRKELEAAAKLLAQNKQIKEFVAGLERNFDRDERGREARENPPGNQGEGGGERSSEPGGGNLPGRKNGQPGKGNSGVKATGPEANDLLKGKGKETRVAGTLERKPGGEYLFLQAKPGMGAARLPYSSAYPQYRRQAERSVERSNVPPHMRSVVRSYFDAINPDGRKQ